MKTKVWIKIEDRHIDRGMYATAAHCPMSIAIAEAIPLAEHVYTTHSHISLIPFGEIGVYRYSVPEAACDFPARFDEYSRVYLPEFKQSRPMPISFELEVDDIFVPQEKPPIQNRSTVECCL